MPTASLLHTPVPARRAGYLQVVHGDNPSLGSPSVSCPVVRMASCLAEWLVVLQRVSEERGGEQPAASCRCQKAAGLCEEVETLGRRLAECKQVVERVGAPPPALVDSLGQHIARLAATLRSEVSILVPSGVGAADPEVAEAARWLLGDGDLGAAMEEVVEGCTTAVSGLLGVEVCSHHSHQHMEEDMDEDIRSMVASMCGGGGGGEEVTKGEEGDREVGKQVLEKSRKRKQSRPSRTPTLSSPWGSGVTLASPVKRVKRVVTALGTSYTSSLPPPSSAGDQGVQEGGQVVSLLEKKKKLVKKDGLYKFVLWREALRDEKTKLVL